MPSLKSSRSSLVRILSLTTLDSSFFAPEAVQGESLSLVSLVEVFVLIFVNRAHCIDFANADDASLQVLLEACQPAPFGVDNKDVLDESYRKAWKMDNSNFATRLDVVNTGILECIRSMLMQGNENKKIRPEMYKLNVYGEFDSELLMNDRIYGAYMKVPALSSKRTRILPAARTCSVHSLWFSPLATKAGPFDFVIKVKNGPLIPQPLLPRKKSLQSLTSHSMATSNTKSPWSPLVIASP